MNFPPSGQHVAENPVGLVVDDLTPVRSAAQRLRNALRLNAFTSTLGGFVCVMAGGWTSAILGTGHAGLVRLVGLGLVVFAADVAAVGGSRMSRLSRWSPVVSVADAVWVAATVATIAAGWYSTVGVFIVAAVAMMVGGFGVAQFRAWRHLRSVVATRPMSTFDEVPPVEVAHVERTVRGSQQVAWSVVTDHELYGRLAPNLSAVHVQSGTGAGMVRVCSNNDGEEWSETCTLWDEGERFEVNVRTERYPYPVGRDARIVVGAPRDTRHLARRHGLSESTPAGHQGPRVRRAHAGRVPACAPPDTARMATRNQTQQHATAINDPSWSYPKPLQTPHALGLTADRPKERAADRSFGQVVNG